MRKRGEGCVAEFSRTLWLPWLPCLTRLLFTSSDDRLSKFLMDYHKYKIQVNYGSSFLISKLLFLIKAKWNLASF